MRIIILLETALFVCASLVHSGVMISGYRHNKARIAEGVIAIILFSGWITGYMIPASTHYAGVLVQWIALFGTLIGLFTIVIGVGPRTLPDIIFHIVLIVLLVCGLLISKESGSIVINLESSFIETGILYLHSALRYLLVVLLAWSLYTAISGWIRQREYTEGIRRVHLATRIFLNIQMVIGLVLYIMMGFYHLLPKLGSLPDQALFFTVVHITGMIIGIGLINAGYAYAAKAESDKVRYRRISVFYGLGFLIIFMMIPWPFFHSWAAWF